MPGCAAKTQQLYPSLLDEELDESFRFSKDRKRDPFHGKSVRMKGKDLNDLMYYNSYNPELQDISSNLRNSYGYYSYDFRDSWETPPGGWYKPTGGWYKQPRCSPVTAIDLCDHFNFHYHGNGKRVCKVWEAEDALHTHAVHVRRDKYNKIRHTKDTLFDVPVIGFKILADNQQLIKWVLSVNSTITKTYKLSSVPGGRLRQRAFVDSAVPKWVKQHECKFCWSRDGRRCGTPSLTVFL
jgi:hypothetical protein